MLRPVVPRAGFGDQESVNLRAGSLRTCLRRLGPSGGQSGFPLTHFAARMRGEGSGSLPPFELATGPMTLGAVWFRIERGKTVEVRRI